MPRLIGRRARKLRAIDAFSVSAPNPKFES